MDEKLKRIVGRQIETARADAIHRLGVSLREALERAAEAGGLGGSRLAVMADELAANNLRDRATECVELVEGAVAGARLVWDPEFRDGALEFLNTQFAADYAQVSNRLAEFQNRNSTTYADMLTAARASTQSDVESRLDLLVYSADVNRYPVLARLTAPRYEDVQGAWRRALGAVEQQNPDWSEAAREAVSSVEGLGRILTGNATHTLGDVIKSLRRGGRIAPTLAKSLEGIWGWASNNVRHGASGPSAVDPGEAAYVFHGSEAALGLLLAADKRNNQAS